MKSSEFFIKRYIQLMAVHWKHIACHLAIRECSFKLPGGVRLKWGSKVVYPMDGEVNSFSTPGRGPKVLGLCMPMWIDSVLPHMNILLSELSSTSIFIWGALCLPIINCNRSKRGPYINEMPKPDPNILTLTEVNAVLRILNNSALRYFK